MLPCPVDLVGLNDLAVRPDLVLGAEIKALLGGSDSSDQGATDLLSVEHKRELVDCMWFCDETQLDKGSALG